jgi:gliding motility-associated transport system permease protein
MKVVAMAGRELRAAFSNPLAYVVIAVFALVASIFFYLLMTSFAFYSAQMAGGPGAPNMSVDEQIVAPLFGNMSVVLLFVVPLLTMRLMAEEKRQGTMELLLTSPISAFQLVLGKFLGALGVIAGMFVLTLPCFVVLAQKSDPDWRVIACGFLGILLLAAAFLAIGLFTSSLTENQIIAGVLALGINLTLWIVGWFAEVGGGGGGASELIRYLALMQHVDDFSKGIFDTSHLVYLLSVTGMALFLSFRAVESQRWR